MINLPQPNEEANVIKNSRLIVSRIGAGLVKEKKAAVLQDKMLGESGKGRDILSLLSKNHHAH